MTATYTFPPAMRGDTWGGVGKISIVPSSSDLFGTLTSVRAQFRTSPEATSVSFTLSTADSSILIVESDPAGWEIAIPSQIPSVAAGMYFYDMEFTDDASKVYTLLTGTWRVNVDITR